MKNSIHILKLSVSRTDGAVFHTALEITLASTFWGRLVGLLNRRHLLDTEGLLLKPCNSIHTFGMKFSIDVLFLDACGKVLGVADRVKPNRIRFAPKGTANVLEIAEGNRMNTGINLDDYLNFA